MTYFVVYEKKVVLFRHGGFSMKEKFKNIFLKSGKVMNGLLSSKAINIWAIMFILLICIFYFFNRVSDVLNTIILGLLMITMCYPFVVYNLRAYLSERPKFILKFIRQETENPAQLFDIFSHRSFLYGIIIYSFFFSLYIGMIIYAIGIIFNYNFDLSWWCYNLFFLTSALFSIVYFMYHISVKDISTKKIKVRIRLYLAIIATITASLFGLSLKEILFPLITYLGIALAWLSFFVEKIESEQE